MELFALLCGYGFFNIATHSQDGIEWSPHFMRDCGCQHFEEMVLKLELLIFYEVGDTLSNDHCVPLVLKNDILFLEGYYLLCL